MGRPKYSAWGAYFQSKLANLLFTRELQRRLAAANTTTIAIAAHPGGSRTNLGHESSGGVLGALSSGVLWVANRLMAQSAPMGALPTLRAAVGDDVNGGDYFGPGGFGEFKGYAVPVGQSKRAQSADDARRLWDVSVELTHADYSALDPATDH
jgi:NAD(P)-dependent dehydrogenase (short-subunit alcohol dehydrogenase family)